MSIEAWNGSISLVRTEPPEPIAEMGTCIQKKTHGHGPMEFIDGGNARLVRQQSRVNGIGLIMGVKNKSPIVNLAAPPSTLT
jgi:hypothetical protein